MSSEAGDALPLNAAAAADAAADTAAADTAAAAADRATPQTPSPLVGEGWGGGRAAAGSIAVSGAGKWMALTAALLGWMFDGLEMGLFPLVARPALRDLFGIPAGAIVDASGSIAATWALSSEALIGRWIGVATAGFLVGAATGGVLFGWLGDRIGRVRAMMLSVLTYALFTGLCGLATSPAQIAAFRFISALGMGGEWSLGVALVMEIWSDRSRAVLAGLIGAAANVGFLLIAVVGLGLTAVIADVGSLLRAIGLPDDWVAALVRNDGWRIMLLLGAAPALLTFFIRLFVPESDRWQQERAGGATSLWRGADLSAVAVGALGPILIIVLWAGEGGWLHSLPVRIVGSVFGVAVAIVGYSYPVVRYLRRAAEDSDEPGHSLRPTIARMLLGACLGGIPLLATWAAVQWAPSWADELAGVPNAKAYTQIYSALGAILGTIFGALIGKWLGRRVTYAILCLASLVSVLALYQLNTSYGAGFLASIFVVGFFTASFYGWLPLYLPELFATRVRATGQGFSYNFGRILAAIGALQTGNLMVLMQGNYPEACSIMALIYVAGMIVVWFCPETKGKPLPQ